MKKTQITAAAIAVLMAASLPGTAFAEATGPSGIDTTQSGVAYGGPSGTSEYDEAWAAAIEDNKMEYQELGDLIANYNVAYKNSNSQMVNGVKDLEAAKELREAASDLVAEADSLKSEGMTEEAKTVYKSYKETAKELRKEAAKLTGTELPDSYKRNLETAKIQLTITAQRLMIGYNEALANQELMNTSLELAAASLESANRQAELGMKSTEELQAAQQSYKQAENSVVQFNAKLQSIRQNLQMLTGWSHDADAEIGVIPAADIERFNSIDLERDVLTATAAGPSDSTVKKEKLTQQDQSRASSLRKIYATMLSKKQTLDAAQTDFEAATQNMNAADLKNSMGMMGRLEYLNARVTYLTSKSAKETADMEFFSAMETYDWAVKGYVISDQGGM